MELYERICRIPPFTTIPTEYLMSLVGNVREQKYLQGENVFTPGVNRGEVFLLEQGEVMIYDVIDGREEKIAVYHAPDVFSSRSFFDATSIHVHRAEVFSAEATILKFPTQSIQYLFEQHPHVAQWVYEQLIPILETRLFHANVKLSTLYRTGNITRTAITYAELAKGVLEILCPGVHATKGLMAILPPFDQSKLHIIYSLGYGDSLYQKDVIIPVDQDSLFADCIKEKKTIFVRTHGPKMNSPYSSSPAWNSSMIATTIKIGDKPRGVLVVADRTDGQLTGDTTLITEVVAEQIGLTMHTIEHRIEEEAQEELKRVYVQPYMMNT